jgi:hypothetical protein
MLTVKFIYELNYPLLKQVMLNEKIVLASYPDETFPDNLSAFQSTV